MLRVGAERSTALQRRLRETAGILPAVIAQREIDRSTHVMGVARFERFFRTAARLDVDKQDLKRFSEFLNHTIYDLLLRAEPAARANGRDIIEILDLPFPKGAEIRLCLQRDRRDD